MADLLIKIFTWFAILSIGSTALLVGFSSWIYLRKKMRSRSD